ncbi:LOW QUALITY PROTEIN: hypothetical protein Cgig2_032199 [Carnegiea gigantea]|uniref:Uncharacterized protein n=1 Tax=Carnegiea gigantea TaxID=171969 RepID=A0A9Q1QBQ8_9CARY|nr:LOW QUALITY PROTEIN: hypothetical protein Cgig2_032199 [Carnegiea gigantea]
MVVPVKNEEDSACETIDLGFMGGKLMCIHFHSSRHLVLKHHRECAKQLIRFVFIIWVFAVLVLTQSYTTGLTYEKTQFGRKTSPEAQRATRAETGEENDKTPPSLETEDEQSSAITNNDITGLWRWARKQHQQTGLWLTRREQRRRLERGCGVGLGIGLEVQQLRSSKADGERYRGRWRRCGRMTGMPIVKRVGVELEP